MAQTTLGTTLKSGTSASSLTKMADITSYPDMGGKPDKIDATTMSDTQSKSEPGVQQVPDLDFEANMDDTQFAAMRTNANTDMYYSLEFANGSKYTWQGKHSVYENGGSVNGLRKATISITNSTDIEWTAASGS